MRLWKAILCLLLINIPPISFAGKLYGTLTSADGKPFQGSTNVNFTCGGETYSTRLKKGRYRVKIPSEGRCEISLPDGTSIPATLFSYRESTKYDFVVSGAPGSYTFRRR